MALPRNSLIPVATGKKAPIQGQVKPAGFGSKVMADNDLTSLNSRLNNITRAVTAKGGFDKAPGYARQRDLIQKQINIAQAKGQTVGTGPVINEPAVPSTGGPVTTVEDPAAQNARAEEINKLLFADTQAFGDNAAYNRASEQGQKQIAQLMSARGLLGAGKDLATNAEFLSDLNAKESERVNNYLGQRSDRLYNVLRDEADRSERAGTRAGDNQLKLLELALSQNPLQYGYNAANQLGSLTESEAKDLAKYIASNYQTVRSGGGGGAPSYVPPFASSPNFAAADMQSILANRDSKVNNYNLLNSILSGLTKA